MAGEGGKVLKCPACGGRVDLRYPGKSLSVACGSCGSVLDASQPEVTLISRAKEEHEKPHLKLGTRGTIRGDQFELIGYLKRIDVASSWEWDEYLLFNPYKGYRWLVHDHGHWTYVVATRDKPKTLNKGEAKYHGKIYRLYNKGQAKVVYVLGELYWRVKIGEAVEAIDYISPPEVLSCEKDGSELLWSIGDYIEPDVVTAAFPPQRPLPSRDGIAPNQPSPYSEMHLFRVAFAVIGVLFLIQCGASAIKKEQTVLTETGHYAKDPAAKDPAKTLASEPFKIDGPESAVLVDVDAPLDNHWLDVNMTLVEEGTGKAYDFNQGLEYYSGSDDEGSWSEGDRHSDLVVPEVPAGTYRLAYDADSDAKAQDFRVTLTRGSTHWSNFWVLALLTIALPLLALFRAHHLETRRWANSDYAPPQYQKQEESDDDDA